jgi:hypothetical protein
MGQEEPLTLEEIKDRLDIVELISFFAWREGACVEKDGDNYRASCPFHTDESSSFFIFPEPQTWRCFGACSTGGDVFSLFDKAGWSFTEALYELNQLAEWGKGVLYDWIARENHAQNGTKILRGWHEEVTKLKKGAELCICGQYWLEENLKTKWVPRFIKPEPVIDEEFHGRDVCSVFDQEDVPLP